MKFENFDEARLTFEKIANLQRFIDRLNFFPVVEISDNVRQTVITVAVDSKEHHRAPRAKEFITNLIADAATEIEVLKTHLETL